MSETGPTPQACLPTLASRRWAQLRSGRESGLTLVELMIVLIIIAVLLAIAVPSVLGQRNRANDTVASSRVREAVPSIKAYFQDNSTYLGMTVPGLRAEYDKALPDSVSLSALSTTSYCVESTAGGRTWRQSGPGGPIERASCS